MIEKAAPAPWSFLARDPFQVGLICVAACVGAVLSGAAPTGVVVWDYWLKMATTVLVVLGASKAPRWAVLVFSICAAAAAGLAASAIPGWVALAISTRTAVLRRRNRVLGAAAGALGMQALLRLPAFGFFGLPSIIGGLAMLLVLFAGYQYASARARQFLRVGSLSLIVVLFGILIAGGVSLLNARADVDRGVAAARRGLEAARSADTAAVAQELDVAERALNAASSTATGFPARLLRLIPIAAQHQSAIESATQQGAVVAREAAATVRDADIASLSMTSGQVDLVALEEMAPRLRSTVVALETALGELRLSSSGWLVPFVRNRMNELSHEVETLLPEVSVGAHAAEVLPEMLGADSTKTYFVIFGTPAESREFGGFIGSWALVTFDNGRLELGESGRSRELREVAGNSSLDPTGLPPWYLQLARPQRFPQNLTSSPDASIVALASSQVLGGKAPDGLAGFIYVDTWAVIDMLQVTGPIQTTFQDEPLTYENAPAFFFGTQFETEGSRTELFDNLAEVGRIALGRLTGSAMPGPEELGRLLGPAARAGRLQVVTFDERANEFLRSIQLLRDFGRSDTSDFVGLVQTNGLSNKMDLYLQRNLEYSVEIVDDNLVATATARLRSIVPNDAPEVTLGSGDNRGNNLVWLSLYTPHALTGLRVNGQPTEIRATREFDLERYLVGVTLPPTGQDTIVEFDLFGLPAIGEPYSLEVWHQPLVNSDNVSVEYRGPDGAISWQGRLVENVIVSTAVGDQ